MKNYVKEYNGRKVPEGAVFYQKESKLYHESFWDEVGNVWIVGLSRKWAGPTREMPASLIELPEAQQEWSGEGLPPIGSVCECFVWTNFAGGEKRWVPRPVIGYSKTSMSETHMGKAGIVIDSCERDGQFIFCDEFRPLKTQQEKDREAFVAELDLIAREARVDMNVASRLHFYKLLFEAGFTAPKAADNDQE